MSLRWLPNAISVFRIVLVVPVVVFILDGRFGEALTVYFVAGISDGVDGFLARRFNWHTRLGALLDPIADKLLVACSYLTLAWVSQIPTWLAVVVVLRDVVILGGATAYNFLIAPVQGEPTRISKLNTILEILFVTAVLARAALDWPAAEIVMVLGAGVFVTVVISGADYVVAWSQRAREEAAQKGDSSEG